MSCTGQANCSCGCCAGIAVLTPQGETNPPGQSSIAYRTGTWASFKESMLARLSSSDYPALAGLTTRADNDYSIALLDASALVLDILTFYQERLANESYLGTATQLYSLTQLSQLIGYQPSPGVSASVYLAFTLSASPGLPTSLTTGAITIPAGTTVQSVPGQGQIPQSFQTSADILGKPTWNALAVQTGNPWLPRPGDKSVYLDGTATQLQPGDAFLIVGNERIGHPASTHWDLRLVSSVSIDAVNVRTLVTWVEPLGATPAQMSPKFYAFRQRAALFGYNAISPLLLPSGSGSTGATLRGNIAARLDLLHGRHRFPRHPGLDLRLGHRQPDVVRQRTADRSRRHLRQDHLEWLGRPHPARHGRHQTLPPVPSPSTRFFTSPPPRATTTP